MGVLPIQIALLFSLLDQAGEPGALPIRDRCAPEEGPAMCSVTHNLPGHVPCQGKGEPRKPYTVHEEDQRGNFFALDLIFWLSVSDLSRNTVIFQQLVRDTRHWSFFGKLDILSTSEETSVTAFLEYPLKGRSTPETTLL